MKITASAHDENTGKIPDVSVVQDAEVLFLGGMIHFY